jgi:colanic acid/amylovoran biosynthesis glycosyltransferase
MLCSDVIPHPARTKRCLNYVRRRYGIQKESIKRILDLLRLLRIEADVLHFEWDYTAAKNLDFLRLARIPIVVSCRGSGINVTPHLQPWLRDAYPEVFAITARVHCVSRAIATAAAEYGLEPSKVFINHPSVDIEAFRPSSRPDATRESPFTIVSSGRLHWVKGHEFGLMAARRLVEKGLSFRYVIVGDGPKKDELLFMVKSMRLEDVIELPGHLPRDDIRRILQGADVFLLTSLAEGVSNSVLEAMAMEVPVVATDVGGMSELVRDGIDGYLVPPCDDKAMAERLERLFNDAQRRRQMGLSGRERVIESFNLDSYLSRFISCYESILSSSERQWAPASARGCNAESDV